MASLFSTIGRLLGLIQDQSLPSDWCAPSYEDVCQARILLKALNLPTELVLQILDYAECWPKHDFAWSFAPPKTAAAQAGRPCQATLCLDADVMDNKTVDDMRRNGETPKVRSVKFAIVSRDQAWTSENTHGTFNTSSWLEVSILRRTGHHNSPATGPRTANSWLDSPSTFHHDVSSQGWELVKRPEGAKQGPQDSEGDFAWYLQGNRVAAGLNEYLVVWTEAGQEGNEGAGSGEGFLHELADGDRVVVWARAKWPGWQCIVERVKMTVLYGA